MDFLLLASFLATLIFFGTVSRAMLLILLLDTPDAPSMSLKVDNEPFDGELAVLNAGQMIEVSCTADEGNPKTVLSLTKDGSTFGPEPRSQYIAHTFMVTAQDSGSVLGCKVENENDWSADSQTVELNVLCKSITVAFLFSLGLFYSTAY